ncbi:MAG TPA: AI-2E family transporter [Steroidobacteraceae bacterium]|nr:AI-2E family transporter [Steroidobacteraceae bacterium]
MKAPEGEAADTDRVARLVRSCVLLLLTGVIIFSRTIAVPALAAVLVAIALFPVVNRAGRLGIPRALASLCVLLALVGASVGILYSVRSPLAQLAARAPELMATGQRLLLAAVGRHGAAAQEAPAALVGALTPLLAGVTASLVAIGTSLVLSHFILTCGTGVGRALLAAMRERCERRNWLRVCSAIRREAAHYLQLVTAINVAFGVLTGVVLSLLHVKDAAAYGVIAALMNFIPIVGALVTLGVILAGGIAEHGLSGMVLLPGALFLLLHILESQFVTPQLLGRRLLLNPLIVIAGVLVGAAAWGRGGAFLAVPILTSVKIALDAHPRFRRWGQVLGRGAVLDCPAGGMRRVRLRRGARPNPALSKS